MERLIGSVSETRIKYEKSSSAGRSQNHVVDPPPIWSKIRGIARISPKNRQISGLALIGSAFYWPKSVTVSSDFALRRLMMGLRLFRTLVPGCTQFATFVAAEPNRLAYSLKLLRLA